MKKITLIFLLSLASFLPGASYAVEPQDELQFVREVESQSWSQLIVPDDINWTQRFILTELKELRIWLEATKRELNEELNARELATVDRALSYSWNTVNFLWLIITMAVTGFWLVGWRTMKDVRENLTTNFEKEVQKRVKAEQRKLEEFMKRFEEEQLKQSKGILKNQEFIQKKQEAGYLWSQYNREENPSGKLDLLEKVALIWLEEDEILIHIEKSSIYAELGLWDKTLESSERWLEISSENTTLLYNKASALIMLEQQEEAIKALMNIIWVSPWMKDEILVDPLFENIIGELEEYISNQDA